MSLPTNLPTIAKARLPAVYTQARGALEQCSRIDECKDWSDKAEALASYAKQAQDDELRKMADRIQARAIRRCGELLGKIKRAQNQHSTARGSAPPSRSAAARDAGLSRDQKRTALRVARIPRGEFEDAVESPNPPTVTALAERGKIQAAFDLHGRTPEDFQVATAALGWIREAVAFCKANDPTQAVAGLLPRELKRKAELSAEIKAVCAWLAIMARELSKERT